MSDGRSQPTPRLAGLLVDPGELEDRAPHSGLLDSEQVGDRTNTSLMDARGLSEYALDSSRTQLDGSDEQRRFAEQTRCGRRLRS
ncbi:hypothetical protein GCM10025874_31870 [Arenivirga flava]|uniref:Uncharacterized protein n=2 Tax=Arenivirga flava TaxID=1930060 RepID=A0AA37UGE9_9MICO|nr:hypothetical protein GCM10025874_00740 [Arenivirga flava]GMA29934.1 hypothetical protein GCM10025874_31870 [Arenivirga flava]